MKRTNWKLLSATLLLVTALLCSCAPAETPPTGTPAPAETPPTGTLAQAETVELTLLGTTDLHGHFMPWDYASDMEYTNGSLTEIATLIKEVREERENVILVDCGDAIQDNYNELFKDSERNPLIEAFNALDYDAWVMGNHEYNFMPEVLNKWVGQFQGASLSGVVYYKDGNHAGERYLPATTIVERGGLKVGLVGLTTPMIESFEAHSGTLDTYVIHDGISEAQKALEELEGKADIVVGVMHMGLEDENGIAGTGVRSILEACPGFDAVIAGHFHQNVNEYIGDVPVTEAGSWASNLSRLDLTVAKENGEWIVKESEPQTISSVGVQEDPELTELLTPYHDQLREWVNEPIGRVVGDENMIPPDDIAGIATVQTEPTPYFNLLHEVAQYYSGALVVGFQTDCDTASLAGDIRIKDIAYNYTYPGGEITVYEMKGQDLKDYMEWSAAYFNQMKEGDVTLSYVPERRASYSTNTIFGGVNYKIDVTREPGDRIVELTWPDGRAVDMDETVTLGINSYYMEGVQAPGGWMEGRYFDVVYSSLEEYGDQGTLRNLTITYIKDVLGGEVVPDHTKNWEIIGVDKDSEDYQLAKRLINSGELSLHNLTEDGWELTNIASITVEDLAPFKK